jgi:mono/diheme cytochrome c family protein
MPILLLGDSMSKNNAFGLFARGGAWRAAQCLVAILLFLPLRSSIAQAPPEPAVNAAAGSRVFGAKGCIKCHAVNGLGGTEGPDLGRAPKLRSFYDLAADMWNHGPEMIERMRELEIRRPSLSPRETGDLIAFLFSVEYFDPPGDPAAGEVVFNEKRCVLCHQVGGVGGVVGPDLNRLGQTPSPIQVATSMWNHGPAMSERLQEQGIARSTFTGAELINLIAYLRSASEGPMNEPLYVLPGRAGEGRRLFVEKSCSLCHGSPGTSVQEGPDLAERAAQRSLTEFASAMWNKQPRMLRAMRARGIQETRLQASEMADLVAYLYSLRYFADSGDRNRGRVLIRQKGCLECHSLNGQGGQTAGNLSGGKGPSKPAGVISALWNHTVISEGQPSESAFWPVFRPGEMADLVAFFATQEPPH